MKFDHRSYGGTLFRPTPEVFIDPAGELIIVATPWGTRNSAEKAIEEIKNFYMVAKDDQEATSPFDLMTSLSMHENNLRTSVLFANAAIYKEENDEEYTTGCELFVGAKVGGYFVWAQVGNPSVLLKRGGKSLVPMGSMYDLSLDYSSDKQLPPLPTELMGLEPTVNIRFNNFKIHPSDQLFLVSHSNVDLALLNSPIHQVDDVSRVLSGIDSEQPHWVGELKLAG